MKSYKSHQQVVARHCDATGIVAFPKMSEMAYEIVERWFDDALDWSFARMQGGENLTVPVARFAGDFPAPSRLGDHMIWSLSVTGIGQTSMNLSLTASCGGDTRAQTSMTLVLAEAETLRTKRWPDAIRARAEEYIQPEDVA